MAGSDKDIPDEEESRPASRRRSFVRRAEPTPVTEAMVTPRTRPTGSGEPPPTTIRFCASCGTRTEPGSAYCLACGVRLGSGVPPGEGFAAHRGDPAGRQSRDQPVEGVTEFPTSGWDGSDEVEKSATSGSSGQRTLRFVLVIILVVAVLVVGFGTLRRGDEPVPEPSAATSPTINEAVDGAAFRTYADQVGVLADDVADLRASARQLNDDWDDRAADYDTTLERMSSLMSRTGLLPIRFDGFARPPDADRLTYERMAESLETLVSAAEGMMAGLQSTDTGEVRLAQLARYEAAASEFGSLAEAVERAATQAAGGSGI